MCLLRFMSQSLPPLGWFRAFEAAARHLSFTLAAGELNLTQSAISQHIRSLELRLGTSLFLRKARGIALTDAGRRLLPQATQAIQTLSAATAMFQTHALEGTIRVACTTSFAVLYLIPRLAGFLMTHPGVDVQLVSTLWPDDASGADADVNIRFGAAQLDDQEKLIRSDMIIPVCSPSFRDRIASKTAGWGDIQAQPIIRTVGLLDTWETWCKSLNLQPPQHYVQTVDSHLLAIASARASLGIALVCRLLVEGDLAKGTLVPVLPLQVRALEGYHIAPSTGHSADTLPNQFIEWVLGQNC